MQPRKQIENESENHSERQLVSPRQISSLQDYAEIALVKAHGASLVECIQEDADAMKKADMIEYPGCVRYPGISLFKESIEAKLAVVNGIVLAVVQGDLPQAEALIQQNPMLSSVKGEAIDYSRRPISNFTPFQAALCAWDEEMCEMLMQYMDPEEITRQYNEIFPQGVEAHCATQTPFDFSVLVDVISQSSNVDVEAALSKEQNDTLLCQTLNQFRVAFTNRSYQEKIFNPQHLIRAFQFYDANFERWNWNQCDLFWRQVIGYVQRFLPANLAQDFAQGIYYRVEENEKARRSFNFRFCDGAIFPLVFDSHSGLGFDYAVGRVGRSTARGPRRGVAFTTLMSNKSSMLVTLCNQHRSAARLAAV